jgi:RNA polymerase sigma-70 factor (ECF subfamily)
MTPEELEEEWKLIQKAQKDRQRFGPLYSKNYEAVFKFIYNRIADVEITADICSVTFLKAIEKLESYRFKGKPFICWLRRIGINEVNQYYRRNNKNRVVILEDSYAQTIKDEIGNADEFEINLTKLEKSITMLSPDDLEIIRMRYFEKMSFKEIGEILDIEENNAKVKNHRIIDKLRKIFINQ